jgi:hypothetical protein
MRWFAATLAVLAIGAAGVGPAAAQSPRRAPERCNPPGAQVRGSTRAIRIYLRRRVLFACGRASGYVRRLGVPGPFATECDPDVCYVDHVRVAGRFVGFQRVFGGRSGASAEVVVVDMAARHEVTDTSVTRAADAGRGFCPGRPAFDGDGIATDIALRADGAVAWIAVRECSPAPDPLEVHARGPLGDRLLAVGFAIGAASLDLDRGIVTWLDAGAPRRAQL